MITTPKISVVLPFFNAEKTLERAINSILNQTFTNFELILVNNNSTDESESIARHASNKDSRIKLINENKQGVAYAANTGNNEATGQYIARMDADDYSYPIRLEKQNHLLDSNPEIGVTSTLVNRVGHTNNTLEIDRFADWGNKLQSPEAILLNRFTEIPAINTTVLFRKHLLKQYGGYIHGDFPEDYELWLRWLNNGVGFQKIPEILLDWYDSEKRLTRTDSRYSTDAFYLTKAYYLSQWLMNINHPYIWVWGASDISRKKVKMLQNKGIFVEGYIDAKQYYIEDSCCIPFESFNWEASSFILSYIDNWEMRDKKRDYLLSKGKIEGKDFILVT